MAVTFSWGPPKEKEGDDTMKTKSSIDTCAVAAELLAMFLFVVIGCGVACGNGAGDAAQRLMVAFAFGMGILVLAYSIGHESGGQINCAVTFSLCLSGKLAWRQGFANLLGQLIGSLLGAFFLWAVFPCGTDMTGTLGTNIVDLDKYGRHRALIGEIFGTFLLCFVVYQTAVSEKSGANRQLACLAIGFAVFLAHIILLPIDGCSINPTRSFGPAIVGYLRSTFDDKCQESVSEQGLEDLWVMWLGPLFGAATAAAVQKPFLHVEH